MYGSLDNISHENRSVNEAFLAKWVPRISLIVGLCAFIFQVTVLYPWHMELSEQFAALAKSVKNSTS